MTNTEPLAPVEAAQSSAPTPPSPTLVTRGFPGIAVAGIALGSVVVAGLLFGGGVAVGLVLPFGSSSTGTSVSTDEGGFPGGGGEQGTRPSGPRSDSNQTVPTAPNSDDTETPQTDEG